MKALPEPASLTRRSQILLWLLLLIVSGFFSTLAAAAGWIELHRIFKPLTMVCALLMVLVRARTTELTSARFELMLAAALMFSLLGDVALMFSGYFIEGLVAFLLAHLAYIALFRQGVSWFAHRKALAVTLAIGLAMYVFLWVGGLPRELRLPVAAYVLVIALMAAQALGRASVLKDRRSMWVGAGACFFMASDALLATNRFVTPLPLSQLWVLGTYYAAQILIAYHARPVSGSEGRGA